MTLKYPKHRHHKIPKHLGGTDDPSNIEFLSPVAHAQAHMALYREHKSRHDKTAVAMILSQAHKTVTDLSEQGRIAYYAMPEEKRLGMVIGRNLYEITDPEGTKHRVVSYYTKWCNDRGLCPSRMRKIARGKYGCKTHKGYTARLLEE